MSDSGTPDDISQPKVQCGLVKVDPTLTWAILAGFVVAWIHVVPIVFNQGALEALFREAYPNGLLGLSAYPQVFDDRIAHYCCAATTLALALAGGLPIVVGRGITWWTACVVMLALLSGLTVLYVRIALYPWMWLMLAGIGVIGGVFVAGEMLGKLWLAAPIRFGTRARLGKLVLALVALIDAFVVIPAAAGACLVTQLPWAQSERVYLLLHMKDMQSPLHEEIVELLAMTTDYVLVKPSEKVPHPKHGGPSSLPADAVPGVFQLTRGHMPMLVRRESIEIITPSFDPDDIIAGLRHWLTQLPVSTQPVFRVGRDGPGFLIWTEYPDRSAAPTTQSVLDP